MAHKKGGGSTSNGRDSCGKRLGVKRFAGKPRHSRKYPRSAAWNAPSSGYERRAWSRLYALLKD